MMRTLWKKTLSSILSALLALGSWPFAGPVQAGNNAHKPPAAGMGGAQSVPASISLSDPASASSLFGLGRASRISLPLVAPDPGLNHASHDSAPIPAVLDLLTTDSPGAPPAAISPADPLFRAAPTHGVEGADSVPVVGPLRVVSASAPEGTEPPKADGSLHASLAQANGKLRTLVNHFPSSLPNGLITEVLVEPPPEAPSSIVEADLTPSPDMRYTPSPQDWADETTFVYSLILDRFEQGPGSKPQGDPEHPHKSRHGGNIQGLISRLDYIRDMGASAIIINPVAMNPPDENLGYYPYHLYSPLHLLAVDPHVGTLDDVKQLVREAHKRGLRVILDVVVNHAGPVFTYEGDPGWEELSNPRKKIARWRYPIWPKELMDPAHFERRGPVDDWDVQHQWEHGDFPPNYRKFRLSNPQTQDILIHVGKWWVKETDIDGMRIDTYRHLDTAFRERFVREVGVFAARLGKTNFLFMPEFFHGDATLVAREVGPGRSFYNYPAYFWDLEPLRGQGPTQRLEESLTRILSAFGPWAPYQLRFLDNQDKPRFLKEGDPTSVLKIALTYIMFSIGMPFVYYGTEQLLRGNGVDDTGFLFTIREDLWKVGFNTDSEIYRHLQQLAAIRDAHPALRRGWSWPRWSNPNGSGIFAFSRIYGDEEVVLVMNTSKSSPHGASLWVDAHLNPPWTAFQDALDPGYRVMAYPADGGSMVDVEVPSRGFRVLVREADGLAAVRRNYPILTHGQVWARRSSPQERGIRAFSYIHQGQEAMVLINTSRESRSTALWADANISPLGTEFVDALAPAYATTVYDAVTENGGLRRTQPGEARQGSGIDVQVPPYGLRMLVRRSEYIPPSGE